MMNKDDSYRPKAGLRLKQGSLCKAVEMEIIGASALMEAEALLDSKSSDYTMGFLHGYAHCLKLGERFDVINGGNNKVRL
jgi:hypothetical protein